VADGRVKGVHFLMKKNKLTVVRRAHIVSGMRTPSTWRWPRRLRDGDLRRT